MLNIYFSSDIAPVNNIAKIKPKTKENFIYLNDYSNLVENDK